MTLEQTIRLLISVIILWGVWLLAKYEIDSKVHANPLAYWIFAAAALWMIFKLSWEDFLKILDDILKIRPWKK